MESQLELQLEVVIKSGINIVTCGNCGSTLLHKVGVEKISCPYCGIESDICDFPDLNY